MDRLRTVLVGIDFTPSSAAALSQALRLVGPARDSPHGGGGGDPSARGVVAAHVIETGVLIELQEAYAPFVRDLPESLVNDARSRWQSFCAELPGKESVRLEVVVGSPVTEMTRLAQELRPDLIVAGTHGASGGAGGRDEGVGTLAAQLVRRIPTSPGTGSVPEQGGSSGRILLVREKQTGNFRRIVACVDFSETSRRALAAAAQVASHDGAELHVLHIFRAPWKQVHWHSPTPQANPDFQKQYSDALRRRLEDFAAPVAAELRAERPGTPDGGVIVELFDSSLSGSGADISGYGSGISEYAQRIDADLVVLGTHGRSNLRTFFLGSTAERVLRHTPCSVLAVGDAL
jgi:universal stress protein E